VSSADSEKFLLGWVMNSCYPRVKESISEAVKQLQHYTVKKGVIKR